MRSLIAFLFAILLLVFTPASAQLLSKEALDSIPAVTSLEAALKYPDQVVKLELEKEKLTEFPGDIMKLKNLQWLSLRHNKLTEFPRELAKLPLLQYLDLSRNKIDTIYPELGKLKNLYYLNMNNNEITYLPAEIGQLTRLEKLDLWSNYMFEFPREMRNMSSLRDLDLRAISLNDEDHRYLFELLPRTKIHFSHSCNCTH